MKRQAFIALTILFVAASCSDNGKDKEEKRDSSGADARPAITIGKAFTFSGKTTGGGEMQYAQLLYTLKTAKETVVRWEIAVTESSCGLTSANVDVGLETAPDEFLIRPTTIPAGQQTIMVLVNSATSCDFKGTVTIHADDDGGGSEGGGDDTGDDGVGTDTGSGTDTGGGTTSGTGTGTGDGGSTGDTGGDEGGGSTTGGDDGQNGGGDRERLVLGESVDFDWTTFDMGDGFFGYFAEYDLSLSTDIDVATSYSGWSLDCDFDEWSGPDIMIETSPGEYEELPWTLPAGDHVIMVMISSTQVCQVSGQFAIDVF